MLDAAGAHDRVARVVDALQQLHDAAPLLVQRHHIVELVPHLQRDAALQTA